MTIRSVVPDNIGWLEYDLSKKELDHVWKCIENKKQSMTAVLAGNIDSSFELEDTNGWFATEVITKLLNAYGNAFKNLGETIPNSKSHPYYMNSWWVNY